MLLFAHLGLTLVAARFLKWIDPRFLSLGALLPDIVDKPVGLFIYGSMGHGRIFAHTLLFVLVLILISLASRDPRAASLSTGVLAHLFLDAVWLSPAILLWPLLGPFPPADPMDTLSYIQMLLMGLKRPDVLIPECAGLLHTIHYARSDARGLVPFLSQIRGETPWIRISEATRVLRIR